MKSKQLQAKVSLYPKRRGLFIYAITVLTCIFFSAFSFSATAQNIAINETGNLPDTSAMLDISSTTKGLLIPRMTTAQIIAIPSPATGLLVYNTTLNAFEVNTGNSIIPVWPAVETNTSGWSSIGNSGTSYTTNFLGTTDNAGLYIRTNNIQRMVVDSIGNIGIGTVTPSYKLHISSTANPLYLGGLQNGTASDSILTIQNGVVKILSPGALITSSSNAWSLVGNSGTNSSTNFIGTTDNQALAFKVNNQLSGKIETSATANTGFGYQANLINTGTNNTAFGSQTLKANTGGTNNTAIGASALKANTNGTGNVAIGTSALASDTVSSNTAIGAYSLQNSISGASNTATGYASLGANRSGNGNTANGAAALQSNTTGANNTGMGNGALQFATSASSNTSVGAFALQSDTSGAYNVAVGYGALGINTNASGGTAVGYQAGATNTIGTYNTLIGYQADVSSANLTNATAIGYNTKVTTSNSLILGNGANVGIGSSSPGNKLEINTGVGGTSGLRLKQMPQGAVLFMSATGDVAQNNSNFYFDATNYRLSVGAGTSPNSTIHTTGSLAVGITTKTTNYTATVNDHTILCNNTSGSITISLPPASGCTGRIYVIKKISAAGNNVVVAGYYTGDTIDGTTTKTLTAQYNALMIQSDGVGWNILSSF